MNQQKRAIITISLCGAFLFYKYILQNFPSIMAPQLMAAFHLQGLGLGMLSGVFVLLAASSIIKAWDWGCFPVYISGHTLLFHCL